MNRTRYVPWDFMWWVEGCRGNLLDKSIQGFHTVNIFLDERWGGMEGSGIIGIPDFVSEKNSPGTTPLQVANQLDELAEKAMKGVSGINAGENMELRETLGDIRTQARLGQYYAAKIRGTVAWAFPEDRREPLPKRCGRPFEERPERLAQLRQRIGRQLHEQAVYLRPENV